MTGRGVILPLPTLLALTRPPTLSGPTATNSVIPTAVERSQPVGSRSFRHAHNNELTQSVVELNLRIVFDHDMKTRSAYISALLNILVIIFTMNATLAHSTCTMSGSSAELSKQTDQSGHTAMPCHEAGSLKLENPEITSLDNTNLNQCCSDCSVISVPMDTAKAIPTAHPDIVSATLTASISRNIELPFRPPITDLS